MWTIDLRFRSPSFDESSTIETSCGTIERKGVILFRSSDI
jgi:hypothetical protein